MTSRARVVVLSFLCLAVQAPRAFADAKADALAEMEKAQENLDRGEYDQAVARFNVARSLFPSSSGPYLGLGLAHARAGRCADAMPFLEEYLRRKVKDPKPEAQVALEDCKKKTPGKLSVLSDPDGADVRIDDPNATVVGTTPFDSSSLPNGRHRILLSKTGYLSGARDVTIAPGTVANVVITLVVEPKPPPPPPPPVADKPPIAPPPPPVYVPPPRPEPIVPGKLVVEIRPGGTVSVNGVQVAENTPRFEGPLVAGVYNVLVERDGYRSATTSATIVAGETLTRAVKLEPLRKSAWLGLAIPFTLVALGSGIGALVTFYAADGHPPGADFDNNKTANAALQGVFYPSLAIAATGYLLYGLLNRGHVADGPPVRVSLSPIKGGGAATLQLRF